MVVKVRVFDGWVEENKSWYGNSVSLKVTWPDIYVQPTSFRQQLITISDEDTFFSVKIELVLLVRT